MMMNDDGLDIHLVGYIIVESYSDMLSHGED